MLLVDEDAPLDVPELEEPAAPPVAPVPPVPLDVPELEEPAAPPVPQVPPVPLDVPELELPRPVPEVVVVVERPPPMPLPVPFLLPSAQDAPRSATARATQWMSAGWRWGRERIGRSYPSAGVRSPG